MKQQRILITGGTGSLGTALVTRWHTYHRVTVLSRNPHNQQKLRDKFGQDIDYILADICDYDKVYLACREADVLVHAAAVKQIEIGTYFPREYKRVNVDGAEQVAYAWFLTHGSHSALLISTDKAVAPVNFYGQTKALAEGLFREYDFSVLRYGNVVDSRGSFLDRWKPEIEAGRPIELRSPTPTRFYLTLEQAVDLVEAALEQEPPGIFVPRNLRAFSPVDVAKALEAKTYDSSLLDYEKQHEVLVAEDTVAMPENELLARIRPGWSGGESRDLYRSDTVPRMSGEEFLGKVGWNL